MELGAPACPPPPWRRRLLCSAALVLFLCLWITGDDWDNWKDVSSHFTVSSTFAAANKIGAMGLRGRSWPDLDMLPFGWLTDPGANQGPHRTCNLTFDEQKSQMTLWSMARSPLIRRQTASETNLLMFSRCKWHAKQMWELNDRGNLVSSYSRLCATVESSKEGGEIYLAFFNLDSTNRKISARISDLEKVLGKAFVRKHSCSCTEVWSGKNLGVVTEEISAVVNPHGSVLFEMTC
ncbi:hypothetical protein BRADI_2g13523v3 [Brachypodium distachyon]|uniref:alpha-galactosidase n=1 Tax=Brachypodium distachyon TaxID=15368 RepID=A0A2K2D8D8_BRADI|nr:hypothetical protein BRADI_2g13523v3 [Brachypodium distachyon]